MRTNQFIGQNQSSISDYTKTFLPVPIDAKNHAQQSYNISKKILYGSE